MDPDRITRAVRRRVGLATTRLRIARARFGHRVLVIGDSHAGVFFHPSWNTVPVRFTVRNVRAATMSGLANRGSQSGARRAFDKALATARSQRPGPDAIITLLGEVDCGYLLWMLEAASRASMSELLDTAVANYRDLLAAAADVAPVIVLSVPLPTLTYQSEIGDYAKARRDVQASQSDRTALVLELNRRVHEMCLATGSAFVDLDAMSMGQNQTVSPLLVDVDPTDHHYDRVVHARMLQRALAPVLGYALRG